MNPTYRTPLAIAAAFFLLISACSGGADPGDLAPTETSPEAATGGETPEVTETTGSGQAVSDPSQVQTATVQIVSKGSFALPADSLASFQEVEGAGSGSGFIIDPSGVAVTNNHVVTGNASLEVFVGGSTDPVNATVLGVSECSDLAVIQLNGGPYPYLEWYEGTIDPGLEVRAAGFPLGDPEFTMTSGIVSKAEADGDTDWASVDSVIEHDANIQPGNSGGPLVDADSGKVVAVNYAGGDPGTGTSQFFAISSTLAQQVVEQLKDGDVESLGINGQAVADEESGLAGVWVAGVDTNSPAGELGLRGGDIIERIEGLTLGTDGTMKDYCDVLASRESSDKLAVQVLRFDDQVRLSGEFNGDELSEMQSLAGVVEEGADQGLSDGSEYTEFTQISDDTGAITVEVPTSWSQVDGTVITLDDGSTIANVSAAPDLQAFFENWDAPGLSLSGVGPEHGTDVAELLGMITASVGDACTPRDPQEYFDGLYTGLTQVFTDCGSSPAVVLAVAAQPEDMSFTAIAIIQLATEADIAVVDRVVQTFFIQQ